jgi:superfamily I DNA and RNA helicase
VSGGAGTGKTVLAVEKAKKLAAEGFRTLLTCYNNQLASHLNNVCYDVEHLEVMSFHQLCKRRVDEADSASGRNLLGEAKRTYPDKDLWDVRYPNALAYSIDILEDRYDAIVCDEGQDFGEDFWVPLELLLADYEQSPFYIFFDQNQDIYSRASSFPITTEPYYLTVNCRNTEIIHNACYRYYKGEPIDPPSIHGRNIEVIDAQSTDAQAKRLHARIVDLISNEQVREEDIAVLIADGYHKSQYYESIRHLPLPGTSDWIEEGPIQMEGVLMDTVRRFKGLEAPVVILWGLDGIDLDKEHETLYVGMSRAKSLLVLAGSQASCTAILEHTTV